MSNERKYAQEECKMKVAISSDHGGFRLKKQILDHLTEKGVDHKDFGTYTPDSVNYPEFALLTAEAVTNGSYDVGIICCGTGVGVSIVANKVPGIRAAHCHDTFSARMSREHNDANILTLGERVIGTGVALEIVDIFLGSHYVGGRHACRVDQIKEIETKFCGRG